MFILSVCSDSFDPREDGLVVDSVFINDCYFVAFEAGEESDQMGVAVYRTVDEQQKLDKAELIFCKEQDKMVLRAQDTYVKYITAQDREGGESFLFCCAVPESKCNDTRYEHQCWSGGESGIEVGSFRGGCGTA